MATDTNFQQYLTYQHNVQKFFREHSEKYQGVIIPISISTSFPTGTYGFIRALCAKNVTKHYAIDPRTALFQKNWNRAAVRKPHQRMADVFGSPFEKGLTRALKTTDLNNKAIKEIATSCIEYQLKFKARQEDAKKLEKYKRLLGVDSLVELAEPQHLIPPYFEFKSSNDSWLNINMEIIRTSLGIQSDVPIRPVIHFKQLSQYIDFNEILAEIKKIGIAEIWLYPNDFHEHGANINSRRNYEDLNHAIRNYKALIQSSINNGISPYTLFGGYLAVIFSKFGLRGFGNGIGYGEWRESGYHSGGNALNRIYIYQLHRYLDPQFAQSLIDSNPEYFISDFDILDNCYNSGRPLDSLSREECLDHFMECRKREMDFVRENTIDEICAKLSETINVLKDIGQIELQRYGLSLRTWVNVIESDAMY